MPRTNVKAPPDGAGTLPGPDTVLSQIGPLPTAEQPISHEQSIHDSTHGVSPQDASSTGPSYPSYLRFHSQEQEEYL